MKKISFLLMCLLFTFGLKAQITREQANTIVFTQIYANSIDNIDIYSFPNMHTMNDEIELLNGDKISIPYESCWTYVINTAPMESWHMPLEVCFVNALNREYTITESNIPLKRFWCDVESLSLMEWPEAVEHEIDEFPIQHEPNDHLWAILIVTDYNEDLDGVEIKNARTVLSDLACVYTSLTRYGFKEKESYDENSHIIVFAPADFQNVYDNDLNHSGNDFSTNGDFYEFYNLRDDIIGHLHEYFMNFSGESHSLNDEGIRELTEEDQLFIYFTGKASNMHDEYNSFVQFKSKDASNDIFYAQLKDETFAEWTRNIKCSQMTLLMQNPYAGGFAEEFHNDIPNSLCKNRIAQAATSKTGYAFGEHYKVWQRREGERDNVTGITMVDEFTYYWSAACLGYYPVLKMNDENMFLDGPWNAYVDRKIGELDWSQYFNTENENPHSHFESLYKADQDDVLSLKETFDFANNLDTWSQDAGGYFQPSDIFVSFGINPFYNYGSEIPTALYESTFTAEAATLRGYEGQVDGLGVNSGTATQPYRLCGDLWVGPDSDLTMWDDIYSPEDVKIYIEPTGMLTMDGCTFDKLPETDRGMWQGVQVWGQFDQPQDLQHQGALYMDSACINNAIVAVDLWNPWVYETTGGIFSANNSTFINNAKGLRIEEYQYRDADDNIIDYNADLKNCTFLVNDNFIGTENFCEHVKLVHVKGLRFDGCQFKLELEHPNSHVASWAKGILAFDAGFRLDSYDWQGHPMNQAEVKGLFMGVHAVHDLDETTMPFNIFNTNFVGNDCGVFASQVGLPTIVNSNFLIGRQGADCAMGIYAEGINDFAIEQNNFRKAEHAPQNNYGVVIKESKSEKAQIYNNNFSNLYCGNLAIGLNRNEDNEGLEYRCNDNSLNDIDFYVWKEYDNPTGIQSNQGMSTLAASNKFSSNAYHIYNGGDNKVIYYYQRNAVDEQPIQYNTAVTVYDTETSDGCPLRYDTHVSSGKLPLLSASKRLERETDYYNALNTYNSVKTLYNRLTDGGNTNGTISSIKTANPWQMWDLRAQLLGASPYLSEEVLKEVADRNDVFTESVLFEILASNPDELKRGDIIDYVKNKTNPLPEYMTDILEQVAAGNTYKTVLLNQMSSYSRDYHNAATDIIRSILADSIVNTTELRGWLGNLNDLGADREIIASYMAEGDFDNAFALANMLPTLYEFASEEMDEHADYMRMLNLYRNLRQAGRNTRQLTQQEIEDIEDIAENSTGTPQRMAQNILEANSLRHFADCPNAPYPGGERGSSAGQIDPELFGKAMGLSVEAKPNPATTWVAINYTLPGDAKAAAIEIVNSLGVKVLQIQLNGNQGQKVLDLRELANGVYTITVLCGEYYQTEKLVITK